MKIFLLIGLLLPYAAILPAQNAHLTWAVQFSGQGTETIGNSIATDDAGNVYTTGFFKGSVDFDPGPGMLTLDAVNDVFVSKLNAAGDLLWAKQMKAADAAGFGIGGSIAVDAMGNVYTSGMFDGSVDFDPGAGVFVLNSPDTTHFISKLDAAGNFVWAKQINVSRYSAVDHLLAVDPAGNVYITGSFSGTVDFDPGPDVFNMSSFDNLSFGIYVEKLTTNGDFLWAKQIGGKTGTDNSEASSIALDPTGNIYTTGAFAGITDFDPGAAVFNLSAGGASIYVSKLDGSGNFIWAKQLNGQSDALNTRSIAVDRSGNPFITGVFLGDVDFDPGPAVFNLNAPDNYYIFCAKLDAAGNFVWAKEMGGTGFAVGASIDTDPAGNVYLTGGFNGSIVFSPGICELNFTAGGNGDIFISRIDADGQFAWVKQLAGNGYSAGQSVAVDPIGDIYTTGFLERQSILIRESVSILCGRWAVMRSLFKR